MHAHRASHGRRRQLQRWLDGAPRAISRLDAESRFGRYALDQGLAAGTIERLLPRTFVAARHAADPVARLDAVRLWGPAGTCVAGATAVAIHAGDSPPERIDITVRVHARAVVPPWISVRWLPALPAADLGGLTVLQPAHAIVDAWHRARADHRADVFYRAIWARIASPAAIEAAVADFARVRDRRRLLRMVALAAQGATSPTEVPAKTRVFAGPDFAAFDWQVPMWVAGRSRVLDMWHRGARLAVELDGAAHHAPEHRWAADRQRDAELAREGIMTVRYSYADVRDRAGWCRATLLAVLAARAAPDAAA